MDRAVQHFAEGGVEYTYESMWKYLPEVMLSKKTF